MGFPPIHYHHAIGRAGETELDSLKKLNDELPFLSHNEGASVAHGFPRSASDQQCLLNEGGENCFCQLTPPGYGKRIYESKKHGTINFIYQDVRQMGSPPLSAYMDFAELYITKRHQDQPPLKPVMDISMYITVQLEPPHTYPMPYNHSVLQFVMFYYPMKLKVVDALPHFHPHEGDEYWIVRGTQDDIGIPKSVQHPPHIHPIKSVGITGGVLPLWNEGTLDDMKRNMEMNIKRSAFQFKHRHGTAPARDTEDAFVHYTNETTHGASSPEILCKYYASVESDGEQEIAQYRERTLRHFKEKGLLKSVSSKTLESLYGAHTTHGHEDGRNSSIRYNSEYIASRVNKELYTSELVDVENQLRALTTGILAGPYYRRSTSSRDRGEAEHVQCNSFEVEAGDFLTLVHFNEPRLQRSSDRDEEVFDESRFLMSGHTILLGLAEVPHISDTSK